MFYLLYIQYGYSIGTPQASSAPVLSSLKKLDTYYVLYILFFFFYDSVQKNEQT